VVATIEDYAIVRGLVADLLADGAESTVPATVRETVVAVAALGTGDDAEGVSLAKLAAELGIDKSAASRRWLAARRCGYLANDESRKGRPARLKVADRFPTTSRSSPGRSGSRSVAVLPQCAPDRWTVDLKTGHWALEGAA
jgi:hypothetical protein